MVGTEGGKSRHHRDATPGPSCPSCYPSQPLVSKTEGKKDHVEILGMDGQEDNENEYCRRWDVWSGVERVQLA